MTTIRSDSAVSDGAGKHADHAFSYASYDRIVEAFERLRSLNAVDFRTDENFGFEVPVSVPGVDGSILNPRDTWADKEDYDAQAAKLVAMFVENFAKFIDHVDDNVRAAALAAE